MVASDDFRDVSEVLQTKGSLQGMALSLRLDIALLSDFLELRFDAVKVGEIKIDMDLSVVRTKCERLIKNSSDSKHPLHQAEGYIFIAQVHAFERSHSSTPEAAEQHLV
jgi:hypothetical protein